MFCWKTGDRRKYEKMLQRKCFNICLNNFGIMFIEYKT